MPDNDSLRRIDIPIPNPALAEWLFSTEAHRAIEEVTARIFFLYHNTLPIRTTRLNRQPPPGNLRAQAYWEIRPGGFGATEDRWFGYVGNHADYAAVIEYGGRTRGQRAQHQLRDAAHGIVGGLAEAPQATGLRSRVGRAISRLRGNTAHRALGINSRSELQHAREFVASRQAH